MGFGRASHRYQARRDPAVALRMRLRELAASRVRYGYRRLHVLLRREGWQANHKRIYRLYNEEGLSIRTRCPRRRRACRYRSGRSEADAMNDVWAMDFVSDRLFDDRPFRILRGRTSGPDPVIEELDPPARIRGKPRSIWVGNGPEFAGRLLDQWAYLNKVELDFSRRGKPSDNAFVLRRTNTPLECSPSSRPVSGPLGWACRSAHAFPLPCRIHEMNPSQDLCNRVGAQPPRRSP